MSTTETRIEQIVKGIDGLSEEDYTSTGIPRVESLEAITGIAEITGDERDEAWEKYQVENATTGKPGDPNKDKGEPEPESEPEPEPQATKPEEDAVKAPYVVVEGKSLTSRKGILGPGVSVLPEYFGPNGETVFKNLKEKGLVVAT